MSDDAPRSSGFGERFALVVLAAMVAALGYVRFQLLPARAEGEPVPFAFENPMLDAQPGERALFFQPDYPANRSETERVAWRQDEIGFQAWCEGKTGFPIVDAAMRQLLQTGWMHNRLRMITASFLSKLLLIDWHRGEQFFMQHLIDGEFAANNGGWQWSASTGVDAAPYFRVFNPTRQSERFDADGEFIRRFVPELRQVPGKQIHNPSDQTRQETGYPMPVVDYKPARQAAIEAFANLKT